MKKIVFLSVIALTLLVIHFANCTGGSFNYVGPDQASNSLDPLATADAPITTDTDVAVDEFGEEIILDEGEVGGTTPIADCTLTCVLDGDCPPTNCPCVTEALVEVVNVHIKKMRPRGKDYEPGPPWVELEFTEGVYDLMELRDDLFGKLGAVNIPVGHYSMIRLMLKGQTISFCDDETKYPFYVSQENKNKIEIKKGIKLFETFYVCPDTHTLVKLKFPEEGLLTWIKANSLVRLHPKIWVHSVTSVPLEEQEPLP